MSGTLSCLDVENSTGDTQQCFFYVFHMCVEKHTKIIPKILGGRFDTYLVQCHSRPRHTEIGEKGVVSGTFSACKI